MVVEHIDGEEEDNVNQPALQGNLGRGNEKGRASFVKLGHVARDGHKEELHKRQECPYEGRETRVSIRAYSATQYARTAGGLEAAYRPC